MRALRANLAAEATHHRLGRADRVEFTEFDLYPDRPPAAAADPAVFHVGHARDVGRLPTGQPQPAGPVPPAVAAPPAVPRHVCPRRGRGVPQRAMVGTTPSPAVVTTSVPPPDPATPRAPLRQR